MTRMLGRRSRALGSSAAAGPASQAAASAARMAVAGRDLMRCPPEHGEWKTGCQIERARAGPVSASGALLARQPLAEADDFRQAQEILDLRERQHLVGRQLRAA